MTENSTTWDRDRSQAIAPDMRRTRPSLNVRNASEAVPSRPLSARTPSSDDTQITLQYRPRRITTEETLVYPNGSEPPVNEPRGPLTQRIEPVGGEPTSTVGPPTTTSTSDVESPEGKKHTSPKGGFIYTLRESLGSWGGFVIFGGCIGILGIVTFISFLWFGGGSAPEAATASSAWLNIVLNNRAAQAITLSSLLLRIIVATQATSCTSMLAALFLERRAVLASQLPHFSVARGINDGPRALLQKIIGSGTRRMLLSVEAFLMLILTLTLLGLQFSSTVLIADLENQVVVDVAKPTAVNTSFVSETSVVAWVSNNFYAPTFATYGETLLNVTAIPDSRGISDTGLRQRALLPLDSAQNRTTIRSYQGSAVVGNTRVACMPPRINGTLMVRVASDASPSGRLQGTLDYNASIQAAGQGSTLPLCQNSTCEPFLLDCSIPGTALGDRRPQSSICVAGGVGGDYWPRSDGPSWKSNDVPWAEHSPVFLVLATDMDSDSWKAFPSTNLPPAEQHGEWVGYKTSPTHSVNVSMCFVDFNYVHADVNMTAPAPLSEPKDSWSVPESLNGSTLLYRRYLGTDLEHLSHRERGILTLNNPSAIPISDFSNLRDPNPTPGQQLLNVLEWSLYFGLTNSGAKATTAAGTNNQTSIIACSFCVTHGVTQSPQVSAILTDIINHTKRPALALESWVFMQMQMSYTQIASNFDKGENITLAFTRVVAAPGHCWDGKGCRGFIAVSVFIGVHVICVVWIVVLYLTRIRYSRHGDIWHTVSQLQCDELRDILAESRNATDDEVIKLIGDSSRDYMMKIGLSADGSRIGAMKSEPV
ncbi:hypothetical protein F4802DRAFT_62571 [Xylaria palmicola]|nr:hypothetical protein F4802DRAFT_62571 [Xylaria palmicola]